MNANPPHMAFTRPRRALPSTTSAVPPIRARVITHLRRTELNPPRSTLLIELGYTAFRTGEHGAKLFSDIVLNFR